MSATIDMGSLQRQIEVLDVLLYEPDAVTIAAIRPEGWHHDTINVRDALRGLRNLGGAILDQVDDGAELVVLEPI